MRPAESRKEVIESQFVGYVDGGKRETPLITIALEQIVVAHDNIEQAARRDALRIVIVVFRPWGWYFDKRRPEL